jgi:hypothetical protein
MLQYLNIDFKCAVKWSLYLNRKTLWANPFFLMQNCFIKESLLFEKRGATKEPAILFFPNTHSDISHHTIGVVFDEDIEDIERQYRINCIEPSGMEFLYSSDDWSTLRGGSFSAIRKAISGLRRKHRFEVEYPLSISECYSLVESWAMSKREDFAESAASATEQDEMLFEDDVRESIETLRIIESLTADCMASIRLSIIVVRVNGGVAGFCVLLNLVENFWVALLQKTNLKYRGIPQLLAQLKGNFVGPGQIITTGGYAGAPNLKAHKASLRPMRVRRIYTVTLGERIPHRYPRSAFEWT